jgi:hypothetical protein
VSSVDYSVTRRQSYVFDEVNVTSFCAGGNVAR